ncbi:alpha/beta hydrolase [Methylobacterium haplocladii]|uniref:Alpha/beta hydrolase n=1 Tax=Methylobacterium haplocladii TaxID=1176176 RepID=A0A512INP0_9HYPH|nr:alpha/beta hydrolase [Methylobacterium haplocladii]GEO99305.1 alpha/beta hydrolase [Methylobacterium haplocladii]GJD83494.1 Monoterpene epsilon-lactone hydrolase [Methylobacterium haplocladii]GLS61143.1 alpha/beta hydrolase [Methylobacterium haplocladii]
MPPSEIDLIRARLAAHPRRADLAARRERIDDLGAGYVLPPDVVVEPVSAHGVPAEWTRTPAASGGRVVLFLHGGGYVSGSLTSHRHMIAQAGREAEARTLALDYRLAPEHPFPAALEDALAGYRFLLDANVAPTQIALAGESAGGGLALATVLSLREAGLPLPGCLWLSSPWTDLALIGASMEAKAAVDPLLSRTYLTELANLYLDGADARDPLVSPIYADLTGVPPMLIQVGSAETLLDDSIRLAAAAGAVDVSVRLAIWPHMIHAWHLFYQEVADGRRSLAEAGAFIRAHLDGA